MNSPTTTGGRPISAFSTTISAWRPRKRPTAIAAPSGMPISVASTTADRLTARLRPTICHRRGSVKIPSNMASMYQICSARLR